MEKEKKKKEKSRPVTSARSFSNRISSYLLASTNGRKKRLITREKERERTTREFPHNSRLCSFEYHSFHSFKRSTLKELFLFFSSLSFSLMLLSFASRLPVNFFLFSPPSLSLSLSPRLIIWSVTQHVGGATRGETTTREGSFSLSRSSRRVAYLSFSSPPLFHDFSSDFFPRDRASEWKNANTRRCGA